MKASDLFVESLEAQGVEYMFGIPGEENLDLLDSLSRSGIRFILTRHEQAAGFMAAVYGRLTGKTGVCLSTLGPGATNLVTAAAYAQLGGMPVLMITGQKPIKTSKQGHFQIIDVVDMMTPLTKYTRQVIGGDMIPACVREAIRIAEEERPGAVHLELPEDIAREETDAAVILASHSRRPVAEEKSISQAVEMLTHARHPLLMIGAGANRKMTCRMLRQFVDQTGIPFFDTQMGKGVLDERHALFLGNAALSDGDFLHRAVQHADVIVNIGHDVIEKPPFFMHNRSLKVIHINFSPAKVDPVYFPQVEVIGDIANSIWQIKERLTEKPAWDFSFFRKIYEHKEAYLRQKVDEDSFPIIPQRLVADIRNVMPSDGIITLDNGIYKIWFARNYKAHEPNTVLLDNALATMGAGLPSAMAARLVHPDRAIVSICGDGGFMMNSQELETAVRLKLNLVIIILKDDAYGMIRWKQADMGFHDFGLTFNNPDFVRYAESYGASGHRVRATEGFAPLLRECLNTPGVHLIELPVDYSENDRVLNHEIRKLSSAL